MRYLIDTVAGGNNRRYTKHHFQALISTGFSQLPFYFGAAYITDSVVNLFIRNAQNSKLNVCGCINRS